ncbi:hypothetical protein KKE48_04810, partial [Patescibacteria group bacterium]|nr:hypothetical protein [Patescibacteria group bacterium]
MLINKLKNTIWKKVSLLKTGAMIAVVDSSGYSHEQMVSGAESRVEWDEIVSIKPLGKQHVYDIEIEGTHNFVGNGIIAHNTIVTGNLGVGTTNPTTALYVNGVITGDSFYDAQNAAYYLNPASTGNSLLVAGNVGIGTTGPNLRLDVYSSNQGYPIAIGGGAQTKGTARFGTAQDIYLDIGTADASPWGVWLQAHNLANSAAFPILLNPTGGNVGIGTTGPGAKLDVASGNFAYLGDTLVSDTKIEIGARGSGNRYSYIDFHGDDTYTDYGLRILRYNTGADAESRITHRGTGILRLYTSEAGSHIVLQPAGNVGIGTASPSQKLDVSGNINFSGKLLEDGVEIFSGMIAPFAGACPTGWTEYTAARGRTVVGTPLSGTNAGTVGTALTNLGTRTITNVPSHSHRVRLLANFADGGGNTVAGAYAFRNTGTLITHTGYSAATGVASVDVTMPYIQLTYCQKTAGADLAEWIQSNQQIEKTNIVSVDPNNTEKVVTSTTEYDSKVIGIITTVPGWLIGTESSDGVQMALAGRVPTKITLKNGAIKPGDPITTSTIPGTGMKAAKAGPIVGKAMEAFNETSSTYNCQDPATGRAEKCGTILVFVNVSWADPTTNQTDASI